MTSKNIFCKCTQKLLLDGHPQEPGPRHLPMPQAAYVDWPKIATARFHLRFLPAFPLATNVTPNLRTRLIHLQKMCSIMSKSAFCCSAQSILFEVNEFPLSFFQLLSLVLLHLLFFTSLLLCDFSTFPAFISTYFCGP